MKSKMPCPPASMPVIRFDHATGPRAHQLREVGHFPFLHESLQQLRIHAIDTEDDQLLFAVPGWPSLTAKHRSDSSQQCQRQQEAPPFQSTRPSAIASVRGGASGDPEGPTQYQTTPEFKV